MQKHLDEKYEWLVFRKICLSPSVLSKVSPFDKRALKFLIIFNEDLFIIRDIRVVNFILVQESLLVLNPISKGYLSK